MHMLRKFECWKSVTGFTGYLHCSSNGIGHNVTTFAEVDIPAKVSRVGKGLFRHDICSKDWFFGASWGRKTFVVLKPFCSNQLSYLSALNDLGPGSILMHASATCLLISNHPI